MTLSSTKNLQVQARGFSVFSNRVPGGLLDDGTQVAGTSEARPTDGGSSGRSGAVVPIVCGVICRRRSGRPTQFRSQLWHHSFHCSRGVEKLQIAIHKEDGASQRTTDLGFARRPRACVDQRALFAQAVLLLQSDRNYRFNTPSGCRAMLET
jgi:hypothetical protein